MMKNAYSMLKVFLVPQIATFLSCFDHVGKRLDKLWLISKFMTPKAGEQIITIHIFPNISRRQSGNGTSSVDVIKRANFLIKKSCQKRGKETSSKPLFIFKKTLYKTEKSTGQHLIFNTFW